MFCGPPDRELSCKVEDLGLDLLRPLDVECRYEEGKDLRPRMCVFTCPPGSEVRGDKTVECTEQGTWSDAYPQCCKFDLCRLFHSKVRKRIYLPAIKFLQTSTTFDSCVLCLKTFSFATNIKIKCLETILY